MAQTPQASPSLESLIFSELDSSTPAGTHMGVIFEEIIDLTSGAVIGHEVLTRVRCDSVRVTPEAWFTKARALQLEARIEARAVELALDGLPEGEGILSVNFSLDCLGAPQIQEALDLLAQLDRNTIVELSENHHVSARELTEALINIRRRGLLVAVDDAGTGQSDPEFVRSVNPDMIKIDRSHVSNIHRSPQQRAFLHAYADLATDSDAVLVTEGVSSPQVAAALGELGAKWGHELLGQGYWLSHSRAAAARIAGNAVKSVQSYQSAGA